MTVLTEKQQLREAIVANRRMLKLLDQQIDELRKLEPTVAVDLADPDRHQPYAYVVEGADKQAGIQVLPPTSTPVNAPNSVGFQNPYYGYVRVQSDAAFVVTRIFVCALGDSFPDRGSNRLAHVDAPTADSTWGISLKLYDESSNRWLLLANNGSQVQQNTAVPSYLFGALPISSSGGLEIPTECVFPRNAVIRAEAYIQRWTSEPTRGISVLKRVHVVFHGYKVYGG